MSTPRYNLRNIRKLVTEVYTVEELRQLCYEEFRPVYEDYAEVNKLELVRHLMAYCERKGLLERLLALIQEDAPAKYMAYQDRLLNREPLPAPGLVLNLAATPSEIQLGQEAIWQVSLRNEGDDLADVLIRQGRTLLDDPFDLAAKAVREFTFSTRPATKGRKQKKVSVTAIAADGRSVRTEVIATVQVREAPPVAVSTGDTTRQPDVLTLDEPVEMVLIRIPAGDFLMGSEAGIDNTARSNEQPQHRVFLPDYYIGKYAVTNEQYATFIKATEHKAHEAWQERGIWPFSGVRYPSGEKNHPATYVSWHDAVAFCRWLSQESGYAVRLPTEAEWEKAARGPGGRIYPWGNDWDYKRLNTTYSELDRTTPVGHYSPGGDSPYGLADMAGNVWEWCSDWFDEARYRSRERRVVRDPQGPAEGSRRVLRGGSWSGDRSVARCAFRNRYDPSGRRNDYGFRVVISAPISK